jgi:hypothetical protein
MRVRLNILAFAACTLATVVVQPVTPAGASQSHAFSGTFGASGSGAGELALVPQVRTDEEGLETVAAGTGVAVDDETDDVYVADTGNHRVAEFDPSKSGSEAFVRAFGADVGGAGVNVCTSTCSPGAAGSEPGQLDTPTFIAVDNSCSLHVPTLTQSTTPKCSEFDPSNGDVYVADTAGAENRVSKFTAQGILVSSWGVQGQLDGSTATEGPFKRIMGIAVDPTGDVWVQSEPEGGAEVFEFGQAGDFIRTWPSPVGSQPTGIALDGSEPEHIYLLRGFPWGPIFRFTTSGVEEGAVLGTEGATFFTSIAADQQTHDVYADQEGTGIADISAQARVTVNCDLLTEPACVPTEIFGEGDLDEGAGVGVDSSSGTVYVASAGDDRVAEFPVGLEGATGSTGEIGATTATVRGVVNRSSTPVTHCEFQYGEGEAYGQESACVNGAGEVVGTPAKPISSEVEVHADLTGLAGGVGYHFRLRLGNASSVFLSTEDRQFATLALATVVEAKAIDVTASSAVLSAKVNPHGVAGATCELEWGETAGYGTSVPCEPAGLGSGSSPVEVIVHLSGLSPNTTYHFNFAVSDDDGVTSPVDNTFILDPTPATQHCENETLREVNDSLALPDCRAYELVTPMDKNGALIGEELLSVPVQIAENGERVIAQSIQCFAESTSCVGTRGAEGEPFQFERTPAGWSAQSLALPASSFATSSAWGFNADTGVALFSAPSPPNGQDEWLARASGGALTDIGPLSEQRFEPSETISSQAIATTSDLSHVMWGSESHKRLWSFDADEGDVTSLYEYPGAEGSPSAPQLVAVSGGPGSHDLISACGSALLNGAFATLGRLGILSADGRTAFFDAPPCAHGSGTNSGRRVPVDELFARVDGEGPQARTVAISQPAGLFPAQGNPACTTTECLASTSEPQRFRGARFEGASDDGTMAYFASPQQLTDQASQDPDANDDPIEVSGCHDTIGAGGCNLYLFVDPQQEPLTGTHLFDVSAGDSSGVGPEVQGMFALSSDGTHAYFIAKGVLTEAANRQGERAVEGAPNLYVYQHDSEHPEGHLTFVATLANSDEVRLLDGTLTANVTPDGRYLVFESYRGLTAGTPREGASQIYRYDAVTGQMQRLSVGLKGFNDNGEDPGPHANAEIDQASNTSLPRLGPARSDPTMSDDGSIVFFQSPVALTPGALNEVPSGTDGYLAQNIYEWEEDGKGSCSEPEGCVSLISDGKDTSEGSKISVDEVELLGTDATGQNVFFATSDRLTPEDTDTQRDYYDARVDGGFPAPEKATQCEGEACHSAATPPSLFGALGTLSFTGPGNPTPPATTAPALKPATKAQQLSKALKACRARKPKRRRTACERTARKRYGRKVIKRKSHADPTNDKHPSGRKK